MQVFDSTRRYVAQIWPKLSTKDTQKWLSQVLFKNRVRFLLSLTHFSFSQVLKNLYCSTLERASWTWFFIYFQRYLSFISFGACYHQPCSCLCKMDPGWMVEGQATKEVEPRLPRFPKRWLSRAIKAVFALCCLSPRQQWERPRSALDRRDQT